MSSEVTVPLGAYSLAHHVYKRDAKLDADLLDSALEAAAPLIVAAELDRLVDETDWAWAVATGLRRRASELRGEGKDGDQ